MNSTTSSSSSSRSTDNNNQQWSLLPQHQQHVPSPTSNAASDIFSRFWVSTRRIIRHNTATVMTAATAATASNNNRNNAQQNNDENNDHACLQDPLLLNNGNSNSLNDDDCMHATALLPPASDDEVVAGGGDTLLSSSSSSRRRQQRQSSLSSSSIQRPPCRRSNSNTSNNNINSYAREMIRRAGNYLAYTTLLTMLILIPMVAYHGLKQSKVASAAIRTAGVMALGTVILSTRLVYLHLSHWYMPAVQKYVVRILWMVPLYAVQSWLSLRFHNARIYIDAIRDLYEAYVIASFVYYLIELLGGQEALIHLLRIKAFNINNNMNVNSSGNDNNNNHDSHHHHQNQGIAMQVDHASTLGQHVFPFSLILQPWLLGMEFMLQCKHGVLQYVVVKVCCTFLTVVCEFFHVYGEGKFELYYAYPYICFIQNISVMYALYCLVMLFSAVNDELCHPVNWHPLGKFLCVKGVVFFTWWQGVIIFYLKAHGIFDHVGSWSSNEVANGLIDYCVCIEMVGFAIAHSYTFSYTDYLPDNFPIEYRRVNSNNNNNINNNATAAERHNRHYDNHNRHDDDNHDEQDYELDDNNSRPRGRASSSSNGNIRTTTYRPPAILDQPMAFKKAFWDSTVPKETIQDIQTLRASVDDIVFQASRPRLFSLPKVNKNSNHEDGGVTAVAEDNGSLLPSRLAESMSLLLFPSSSSGNTSNNDDSDNNDTQETTTPLGPSALPESTSLIAFPTTSLSTFSSSSFVTQDATAPAPAAEMTVSSTITSTATTVVETPAATFAVFPAAAAAAAAAGPANMMISSPQPPPLMPNDEEKKIPPRTTF